MAQLPVIRPQDSKSRAIRYCAQDCVKVEAKTIGTGVPFSLSPQNVSKTGMLLTWDKLNRLPFSLNTIVELRIQGQKEGRRTVLDCLGKIVRKEQEGKNVVYGVRIVQIGAEDFETWEEFIGGLDKLEVKPLPEPAAAID